MSVIDEQRLTETIATAQRVLSARAGTTVECTEPLDLGGSGRTDVIRVKVSQNFLTRDRSLVIKVWPHDDGGHAFARELASYRYATALPSQARPGPHLIAFDHDAQLIVLSDLGRGRAMSELLSDATDDTAIARAVSAWGQALGRMHADTVRGEADFAALLRRGPASGTVETLSEMVDAGARLARDVLADHLQVEAANEFLDTISNGARLVGGGDHRAFSPSDVGPPNILINDDGVQFMDYEWGGFRDAFLDIAYAVITMGDALPARISDRQGELETAMLEAWRAEVQAIWPSLEHRGEFARKVFTARVLWVWMSTLWMLPVDVSNDQYWGDQHWRDLALCTTKPEVIVERWHDVVAHAQYIGFDESARTSHAVADALATAWLR